MTNIKAAIQRHRDIRAELLTSFPELADDDQALRDTLEGCSTLDETVIALIREALAREYQADGLALLLKKMQERRQRLQAGAEKLREAARWGMEESGLPRLVAPDFTALLSKGSPKVVITAPDEIPDDYIEIERKIKKIDIRNALQEGRPVPGACLGNAGRSLVIRSS